MFHSLSFISNLFKHNFFQGVECFDYSKKLNILVTGSLDHLVRIWNPYVVARPIRILRGHHTGICDVKINVVHQHIITYSKEVVSVVQNILSFIKFIYDKDLYVFVNWAIFFSLSLELYLKTNCKKYIVWYKFHLIIASLKHFYLFYFNNRSLFHPFIRS